MAQSDSTGPSSATAAKGAGSPNLPAVSLPKGGGAIRGIGEKFGANPVTGTGSFTVPIPLSPGRSGFGPTLTLSYDSGSGNGPFGLGWTISAPAISRKTDKGLPQYRDAEESDVFLLSGAEDLVPELHADGTRYMDDTSAPGSVIYRYRPRIEGLFARIERWTNTTNGDTHWRSVSRDNITTIYGRTLESRVSYADRDFSWHICETYDDKGNAVVYEYVPEDSSNVDLDQIDERNRVRSTNRYLKRIKYGNKVSRLVQTDLSQSEWLFEVVFDYDEGHSEQLTPDANRPVDQQHALVRASDSPGRPWCTRPDPFSSHRSGFEVRFYRRCHRILMFHSFPELGNEPCLVRSTDFDYADLDYAQPVTVDAELAHQGSTRYASFIQAVTQSGYVRDHGVPAVTRAGVTYLTYLRKSLPPLELGYSKATIQDTIHELEPEDRANLPIGIDGNTYRWVDLNGEGLSGILTEQGDNWFYKANLGNGHFGALQMIPTKPAVGALTRGSSHLLDLAGDGRLDLVSFEGPTPGFSKRSSAQGWDAFRTFPTLPNLQWNDPNLRFVDLDGDGQADILITEDDVFTWHASLAEKGFTGAHRVNQAPDEEDGPRLAFADGTQSVYLADMSGDGLTDLVRIRNTDVCYWPNQGYGRFGPKVCMDNAPCLDRLGQFDQARVRLADIDGSGATDVIYLGGDAAQIYFNQSGNRLTAGRPLRQFPRVDGKSAVTMADLFGNGTACLVWSSPLPSDAPRPLRYIDLMGGKKPHLLIGTINNLGAETHVSYTSSTKFYLEDARAGRPWITKLPFPVHVVVRVETNDRISGNRFVTRYAYHHGYFDGVDREFRGFGMVEQWDTEDIAALRADGAASQGTNIDSSSDVPPVLTRTWYHTGAYFGRDHVSDYFAGLLDSNDIGEYYREPGQTDAQARALLLDDTVLPEGLTMAEEREACRALRGSMLRQEIYAQDSTDKASHPYTVAEQNFTIRMLQTQRGNRHGVFFTHPHEAISYHYERNPADPRTSHTLTLEVDTFGNVLKQAAVAYGRRQPDASLPLAADRFKQTTPLITYTEGRFTNPVTGDSHRAPLPAETLSYELTGYTLASARFKHGDFVQPDPNDPARLVNVFDDEIAYESKATIGRQRRLIEQVRNLYRKNDLTGLLDVAQLESLALPGESYKLAFTAGLLTQVFQRPRDGQPPENLIPDPVALLGGQGGHVDLDNDGRWWVPAGRVFHSPGSTDTAVQELAYARQHFFLSHRYRDPFGSTSTVTFDDHDLLMLETGDPLGNRVTVGERRLTSDIDPAKPGNDYRVLQPRCVMDPNRNRTQVAFDALGMVVGTAVMGKPEETLGDSLAGFEADLTEAVVLDHLDNPLNNPGAILHRASTRLVYDVLAYQRTRAEPTPQPVVVYTLAREMHDADLLAGQDSRIQHRFTYSDGFGREIQKKIQAEPGPVVSSGPLVSPRWVGSGWTIFNNKGKPVRQYEPFFSQLPDNRHRFEFGAQFGVSPILFYDPAQRVIATLHPNHTYDKVVFDPWQQATWDVNDTVLDDPRTDPDIRGYTAGYFTGLPPSPPAPPRQTWHAKRQGGALGPLEHDAAEKAAAHSDTPTITHGDTLGRTFLTTADNGPDPSQPGQHLLFATRVELDIEGNQRSVRDAFVQAGDQQGRIVMQYAYDMLGNRVHQVSMEAGARWTMNDVAGKPIRAWDSRDHTFRTEYDPLRRPVRFLVTGADPANPGQELLTERLVYGEQHPEAGVCNLRGKLFLHLDQAGAATTDSQDFKGNPLHVSRSLTEGTRYRQAVDWGIVDSDHVALPTDPNALLDLLALEAALAPRLEADPYITTTTYDALNRIVTQTTPHTPSMQPNVIRPGYNEANLLERVDANLRSDTSNGQPVWTPFVTNIDYDAKGRRERIDYGNSASTFYDYDPLTFRLVQLLTRRDVVAFQGDCPQPALAGWPGCQVQNLHYTYDPVGNITHIRDDAQQTVFFRNKRVEPSADYTYDAIYRLIEATGREHLGQRGTPIPHTYNDALRTLLPHPGDGTAMGTYIERYLYDAVGNFADMQHWGSDPVNSGWTRTYAYGETSLIEKGTGGIPTKTSNRLTSTTVGGNNSPIERYLYDAHGNMTRMPHLGGVDPAPNTHWDYRDQLEHTDLNSDGTAYYVYDAVGHRVRKVWEKSAGLVEERIYLGGFEIYRRRQGGERLERETLHIMDDNQRTALVESLTIDTAANDPAPPQLIRYQFGNHLGSASLELDEQAQIVSYEEYTPYGSTSYHAVRSQTEASNRYRYTGKERDEESGLYYHGARYYAPWLGRWTASDPLYLKDSSNVYLYALNNPVIAKDPTGGPVWLIPVAIYLGYKALSSAGETAIEAGIAKATGDEGFSVGGAFVKNLVVNSTIGLIPGTSEVKIGAKVALYGAKLAIRSTADATLDTALGKGDFSENLVKSGIGNVAGDALGAVLNKVVGAVTDSLAKKATKVAEPIAQDIVSPTTQNLVSSKGKGQILKEITKKHNDTEDKLVTELKALGVEASHGGNRTIKEASGKSIKGTAGTATTRKPDVVAETDVGTKKTGIEIKTSEAAPTVQKAADQLENEASFEGSGFFDGKEWTIGEGSGVVYAPYGLLHVLKANLAKN